MSEKMEGNKVYAVISKLEDFVNFCRDENLNLNKIDWTATSTGGDKYVAVNRIERIYGLIFDSIIEIYFNSPNLEFYRLRYELSKRELKEKAKEQI